jgi:2-methylcitrate dehydratase PrpD
VVLKPSYAERYSEFATELSFREIPEEVIEHAKLLIMDSIGIMVASSRHEKGQIFPEVVLEMGGKEESTIIGKTQRVPAPGAALANGTLAHFLDFDDSHLKSGTHNGATAVSTALAVGEETKASGEDLLTALVAGLEVMSRIGSTTLNFHDKGFHATGIVGPFGAAVISGKLKGLNSAQLTSALGICGSQAAALMECRYDGTMVKRMHPGWSAHAGILATRFAMHGFTGPRTVFEGPFGLYMSHLGRGKFDEAEVDSLGEMWESLDCLIKPFPCSHYLHSYLVAAKILRESKDFNTDAIESIELLVSETGANLTCVAPSVKPPPDTPYVAQFSLPYAVALMLVTGQARLEDFQEPMIRNPHITAVGEKIKHRVTKELSFAGKPYYSGWIKIRMKDGNSIEHFQKYNPGSRQNPMTKQEVAEKFLNNATSVIGEERAKAIIEKITGIETSDATELTALLLP